MIRQGSAILRPKGGGAFRARGPFTPARLFGGGQGGIFLDFADLSTLYTDLAGTVPATADTDPIRYVADLSGTGNHLNSMFTSTSPIYSEAGGQPGAFFSAGTSERLLRNASYGGAPLGLSGVNGITIAAAFTSASTSPLLRAHDGAVGSANDYIDLLSSAGNGCSIRNYSAGFAANRATVNNSGFSDTTGAPFVVVMQKDATEGRHYRNGVLIETDTGLADPWAANFNSIIDLRNGAGIGGFVFSLFIIAEAIGPAALDDLTGFLMGRAGLA